MTSSSVLLLGALHAHFQDGFLKNDHDFLIGFLGCMVSEIKWFHCKTDVTSSWFLRQRALHAIFRLPILKGPPDFMLVLYCNSTSIVHRFRFNELFMFAGNDVIVISSLGGASGNLWLRILTGRPRLYSHVQLTLFVYLERFRRYSTFLFGWDIPTGGEILGVWDKMTPKTSNERKTLDGRALPWAIVRLSHKKCIFTYVWSDP